MAERSRAPRAPAGDAPETLIADACTYILLFATGRIAGILAELPYQFAVADMAKAEARFVRRGGQGEDARQLIPVDWSPLLDGGHVRVLSPAGEAEMATYVELLHRLDDGEAATLAIAVNRGLSVATDDRVARDEFAARAPGLVLLHDVLKEREEREAITAVGGRDPTGEELHRSRPGTLPWERERASRTT